MRSSILAGQLSGSFDYTFEVPLGIRHVLFEEEGHHIYLIWRNMRSLFVLAFLWVVSFSAMATETCEELKERLSPVEASKVFEYIELKNNNGMAVSFNEFASNKEVVVSVGLIHNALQMYGEYIIIMGVDALVAPYDLPVRDVVAASWGSLSTISNVRTHIFTYEEQQVEKVTEKWDFSKYITLDKDDKLWLWALKLKISVVDSSGNKIGAGARILVHCPR